MADGGLIIAPQQLADRCISWDAFLQDHPDFVFEESIRTQKKDYLETLLVGLDNSPAFSYSSGALENQEFKAAWEWVLKTHPKTATGKVVREWVDLIKPAGWKRTAKADQYFKKFAKIDE